MKSIKHPHSIGNIFLFVGFVMMSYSAFVFANPAVQDGDVLATCVSDGAYGETCTEEKSFTIEKWVRLEGDDTWVTKVSEVEEEDIVLFRVKATNNGEIDADDMKMTDILPDEMEWVGGDDLEEEWDDFVAGTEEVFIIEAKLKASEFDTDTAFEKCVVNKAELEEDEDFIGSDTATVCYNNAEVELPETGAVTPMSLGIAGLVSTLTGALLKRKSK